MDLGVPNKPEFSYNVARSVIQSPGVVPTIVKGKYIRKKCQHNKSKPSCCVCCPHFFCLHNAAKRACRKCGNPPWKKLNVCMMSAKAPAKNVERHPSSDTYANITPASISARNVEIHPTKSSDASMIDPEAPAGNVELHRLDATIITTNVTARFAGPTNCALITGAYGSALYACEVGFVFTEWQKKRGWNALAVVKHSRNSMFLYKHKRSKTRVFAV